LSTKELSREDGNGGNNNGEFKDADLPPQVIETQHELLRSAVEQSEREYLERAIEDSIKSATHQNQDDDMEATETLLLDTAYQASLSAQEIHTVPRDEGALQQNLPNPSPSMDLDLKLALELSQLSEEEIMQRVLNESLAQQHSNTLPPSSSLTASLREQEEMQEAIRISMMNQYATTTTPTTRSVPHHRDNHSHDNERLYHNVDLGDDPELELAIQESFRDFRR
jgi:hypothetical protein